MNPAPRPTQPRASSPQPRASVPAAPPSRPAAPGQATLGNLGRAPPPPVEVADEKSQYLAFRLGEQEYAIDILQVQEIRGFTPITPLPQTPAYVRGAMNLRGTIVPVLDVNHRFSLGPTQYHKFSVIIVVAVGDRSVGLLVDAVSDVIDLAADQVGPAPDIGTTVGGAFVRGIGRLSDRLLILLDLEQIIA